MSWIFDLPNLLICLLAIVYVCKKGIIPIWIGLVFTIYSFAPFFLNDFLFPAEFMQDQFYYTIALQEVRSFNFIPYHDGEPRDIKSLLNAYILSLFPIPYVESVKSMGFFNRFMFFILFSWLYNKKFLKGLPLLFLIFYPSLVLYTSLSLRDPLILTLMMIGIIFLIDQKYLKFFIIIAPLMFLKFQNFYFMLILFCLLTFFNNKNFLYSYRYFFSLITVVFLYLYFDQILGYIEHIRGAMYRVDGGEMSNYVPLDSFLSLFYNSIAASPYFLIKPLPWQIDNFFQLAQSIENIFLVVFLFFFTKEAFEQSKIITFRWLIYIIFSMTLYGLVVFNFGTAVRFKFIIVATYVIGLAYDLYKTKNYKFN
tara:strand:- start:9560 stop:10660 length:1101 start_codon:yes stop_codon:yes gene_type:complete